jgi:hypothetical protein
MYLDICHPRRHWLVNLKATVDVYTGSQKAELGLSKRNRKAILGTVEHELEE